MRVQVYRNITKGVWSVRHKGRVVAHRSELTLLDAEFRVSESGRQRVLREKRKNVHAYVTGTLVDSYGTLGHWEKVSYNPYVSGSFTTDYGQKSIDKAKAVHFTENGKCYSEVN